jgi:hypothetical protein
MLKRILPERKFRFERDLADWERRFAHSQETLDKLPSLTVGGKNVDQLDELLRQSEDFGCLPRLKSSKYLTSLSRRWRAETLVAFLLRRD